MDSRIREALEEIESIGTHDTLEGRSLIDGKVIPSQHVVTKSAKLAREALALLTAEPEPCEVIDCPHCNGNGYTAEHDPSSGAHDGEGNCMGTCPVYVQCETCLGTGKLAIYDQKPCDAVESFWNELHQEAENQYDKRLELLGPIETEDDAAFRKTLHDGWSSWLLAKRIVLNRLAATEPKP